MPRVIRNIILGLLQRRPEWSVFAWDENAIMLYLNGKAYIVEVREYDGTSEPRDARVQLRG